MTDAPVYRLGPTLKSDWPTREQVKLPVPIPGVGRWALRDLQMRVEILLAAVGAPRGTRKEAEKA